MITLERPATPYQLVKQVALPKMINYQTDVTNHDKKALRGYKGEFLYGVRESGTDLLKLPVKKISDFHLLLCNTWFFFFDGKELKPMTREEVQQTRDRIKAEILQQEDNSLFEWLRYR